MAGARTLILVALVVPVLFGAPAAGAGGDSSGALALPDGPAWGHATLDVQDAECLVFVLDGIVRQAGDGQAVLVDVPRVGHLGLYFQGRDALVVRASADVAPVRVDMTDVVSGDVTERAFRTTFHACEPPDGVAYDGTFDAWALHTDGVRADASRIATVGGALAATSVAQGSAVTLWGLRSFGNGASVTAASGPLLGGPSLGAAAAAGIEKTVHVEGGAFGAFVDFEFVEEYELHGPRGHHAYAGTTGSGGTVDPGAFHGPPGEWTAHVRASASGPAGTPRAFFVVADLAR